MIDATGFTGQLFDTMHILFFSGGAMILFLYYWKRGFLCMDEEPKIQMMSEDQDGR